MMSENENGRDLIIQTTTKALQKSGLTRAGEAANRAAADYIFTDYRHRRAQKTIRTQTAALLLWAQYLDEVGAAGELLAQADTWAVTCYHDEELVSLLEYTQSQQLSLPIIFIYGAHYCQHVPAAWQGVTWGLVEGFVKWLLHQGYSVASVNNRLSVVKVLFG